MPKLYSAKQIIRALQKARFQKVSQKGSHIKFRGLREGRRVTVIVPYHKAMAKGTFASILRQADMTKSEFESYL